MLVFTSRRQTVPALLAFLAVVVCTSAAFGGAWTNASGANERFGWSSGSNTNDHFGNPDVTVGGFLFNNTVDFIAEVGGIESVSDISQVIVDVATADPAPADPIDTVIVQEWGTWTVDLSEVSDFTFQSSFNIFRYAPSPLGTTGAIDIGEPTFNPDGTWFISYTLIAGESTYPKTEVPWERFRIQVTNTLQVDSGAPAGSYIEKTGMNIIVPEPSTALFFLVGLGSVALRRSRR